MPGNPVTGQTLGECPSCSACPKELVYQGPDGVAYKEKLLASVTAPSWTHDADGVWRLNAPGSFGVWPRGAYYIKYCSGAWQDTTNGLWRTDGQSFGFKQPVGQIFGPFNKPVTGTGFWQMVPRSETNGQVYGNPGAPGAIDFLDYPVRPNPFVTALGTEVDYLPPDYWSALFGYSSNDYNPQSKFDAQKAASCLYVPFFHAGGEIICSLVPGLPDNVPDPFRFIGLGSGPTFSLYQGTPLFFLTKVVTYDISANGFDLGFSVFNLSRGKWYGAVRLSGSGITDVTTKPVDLSYAAESFPLIPINANDVTVCRGQYTTVDGNAATEPIDFTLEDKSGSTTPPAPSGIPVFTVDVTPEVVTFPPTIAGGSSTQRDWHGKHAPLILVKFQNTGPGPTGPKCTLQFQDNDTIIWPTQSNLGGSLGTAVPGQLVGLMMGGNQNTIGYTIPWPQATPSGRPFSGCLIQAFGYPVKGETSVVISYTVTDGTRSWGPFEYTITLDAPWPYVQGT